MALVYESPPEEQYAEALGYPRFTPEHLIAFAEANGGNVHTINLRFNGLGNYTTAAAAISEALRECGRGLKVLDISNSLVSNALFAQVAKAVARFCPLLETFNFSDNEITKLPRILCEVPATFVHSSNPIAFPPPDILASGSDAIRAFLRDYKDPMTVGSQAADFAYTAVSPSFGALAPASFDDVSFDTDASLSRPQPQSDVPPPFKGKVFVVGDAAAGKTSLVRCLLHGPEAFTETSAQTHGVAISSLSLPLPNQRAHAALTVLDFAGQDVYYNTHQLYIAPRSVFVVVWNGRAGWEQQVSRVRFWLDSIALRAPGAPVIIAMTYAEDNSLPSDGVDGVLARFAGRLSIIAHLATDARTAKNYDSVRSCVVQACGFLAALRQPAPHSWLAMEDALLSSGKSHVSFAEARAVGVDAGVPSDSVVHALRMLHDRGSVLWYGGRTEGTAVGDSLGDLVILDLSWLSHALAQIVTTRAEHIPAHGVLRDQFASLLWTEAGVDASTHAALLQLMVEFELMYRIGADESLVPCLLPERLRPGSAARNRHGSLLPCRRYEFEFMPAALFHRLQWRLQRNARNISACWKYGTLLEDTQGHACAVELSQTTPDGRVAVSFLSATGRQDDLCRWAVSVLRNLLVEEYAQLVSEVSVAVACPACNAKTPQQGTQRAWFSAAEVYDELRDPEGGEVTMCASRCKRVRVCQLVEALDMERWEQYVGGLSPEDAASAFAARRVYETAELGGSGAVSHGPPDGSGRPPSATGLVLPVALAVRTSSSVSIAPEPLPPAEAALQSARIGFNALDPPPVATLVQRIGDPSLAAALVAELSNQERLRVAETGAMVARLEAVQAQLAALSVAAEASARMTADLDFRVIPTKFCVLPAPKRQTDGMVARMRALASKVSLAHWAKESFVLHLLCDGAGTTGPHFTDHGGYPVEKMKNAFAKALPLTLKTLRLVELALCGPAASAVPLAGTVGSAAGGAAGILGSLCEGDVGAFHALVSEIAACKQAACAEREGPPTAGLEASAFSVLDGVTIREFERLLRERDPTGRYGDLSKCVERDTKLVRWLCRRCTQAQQSLI